MNVLSRRFKSKVLIALSALLCYSFSAKAQSVTGTLTDSKGSGVEFANVVLLSMPDSTFVSGAVSDANGVFNLSTDGHNGVLRISSIGYSTIFKSYTVTGSQNLGTIILSEDSQLLGEVVVKGDLPKVRLKGDAMVTNVAGSILEDIGTAENLLKRIPGLDVNDGNVKVFGRGEAEVYINGRKMRDNTELDQLSSDNIKSVEVVNNPGARYAASVKAVVRITTKKPAGEGFGIDNRATVNHVNGWTYLDQVNFNWRKGGFDLQGMLLGSDSKSKTNQDIVQHSVLEKDYLEDMKTTGKGHGQNLRSMLSLNYITKNDQAFGLRYTFARHPKGISEMNSLYDMYVDNVLNENATSFERENERKTTHQLNAYFNGKILGWQLDFNADGYWQKEKHLSRTDEVTNYVDNTVDKRQVNTLHTDDSKLYAAKLVLSHELFGGDFSLGGEYSSVKRISTFRNPEGILKGSDSQMNDKLTSAFVEYSRDFGKLNLQAGLRLESVSFNYYEDDKLIKDQCRDYTDLFPSIVLSLPIGKVQTSLSYATDIDRPNFEMLCNNVTYVDRYTYKGGNPRLKPTTTNVLSGNVSWNWLLFSANYQHIRDGIFQVFNKYSADQPSIGLLTYTNQKAYDRFTMTLSAAPKIGFWHPTWAVGYIRQWLSLNTVDGRKSFNKPLLALQWQNVLELPMGFQFSADFNYSTKGNTENIHLQNAPFDMDLSLFKSFLNKRLTVKLEGTNLLNKGTLNGTQPRKLSGYLGNRMISQHTTSSYRGVNLTVRYNFNFGEKKYRGTGAGQSQIQRMEED